MYPPISSTKSGPRPELEAAAPLQLPNKQPTAALRAQFSGGICHRRLAAGAAGHCSTTERQNLCERAKSFSGGSPLGGQGTYVSAVGEGTLQGRSNHAAAAQSRLAGHGARRSWCERQAGYVDVPWRALAKMCCRAAWPACVLSQEWESGRPSFTTVELVFLI